jgi:mannuronan synthase
MNVVRLVHEAQTQRQHVRVRMPATATIEGAECAAYDWSVGGFSVTGASSFGVGRTLPVALNFAFDGFKFTLNLSANVKWLDAALGRAGFEFAHLSDNELSLLQFLVGSYVSGEIVQTSDLMAIVRRDNSSKPRNTGPMAAPAISFAARLAANAKHLLLLAGLWVAIALVFGLIGVSVYNRLFVIKGLAAVASDAAAVVSAPRTGLVLPTSLRRGAHVVPRQHLMTLQLSDDKSADVASACDCVISDVHIKPGQVVQKGWPLLTLVPMNSKLVVQASVALDDASRVKQGDHATIFLLNDRRTVRGTVTSIDVPNMGPSPMAQMQIVSAERFQAVVTIKLDRALPISAVGQGATATISTF